jgi:hypothetical protein
MDLDDVVPVAEHVTYQSRVIDAPPSVVWDELHRLKLTSLPVSLLLSGVRALPVLLAGRWRGALHHTFLDLIPIPVLASDPPSSVVFGGRGGCGAAISHPRSPPPGSGSGRNRAG